MWFQFRNICKRYSYVSAYLMCMLLIMPHLCHNMSLDLKKTVLYNSFTLYQELCFSIRFILVYLIFTFKSICIGFVYFQERHTKREMVWRNQTTSVKRWVYFPWSDRLTIIEFSVVFILIKFWIWNIPNNYKHFCYA